MRRPIPRGARSRSFWDSAGNRALVVDAIIGVAVLCVACVALSLTRSSTNQSTSETPAAGQSAGELVLAYSPDKTELIKALVDGFNAGRYKTADGTRMSIRAEALDSEAMVQAALEGRFQAVTPDSSLWLDQIDRAWAEQAGAGATLVGQSFRYAVSPVVIAMWEDGARSMGYPTKAIGWRDITDKARSDPNFKWSHPSTSSASGLLATLAVFYAGANKTRALTAEDATAEATLAYVSAVEKTVRYYGEGEQAVIERALKEGRGFLDAFVVQEQMVLYFNARSKDKLVAIYPREGTLWVDHPMALLEGPALTPAQRQVFSRWQAYLLSAEAQKKALALGYRPADLSIPLSGAGSPFTAANGVDPSQPQTTLQVPAPAVVDVVRNVWWYTKRHTNVYLVADRSGSMRGQKLEAAKEALRVFLEQIAGEQEAVGLIDFSTEVNESVPLAPLKQNRVRLQQAIDALSAGGETALLDAVELAYARLQSLNDRERINAIVVMTDGNENHSRIKLPALERELRDGNRSGPPVIIFCIAYGQDADYNTLKRIAEATGGQARAGDLETIRQLYKILSSYF
jgi:Ca-activated chloride channel family protein